MNQQTLYIGFDSDRVAVLSNAPEILAGVKRSFREMLDEQQKRTVGQLEVYKDARKYYFLKGGRCHAESGSLAEALHNLRHEVALHLIDARPDLLWFHAGAAAHRGSAVMMIGSWGRGKSALVTRLCADGWLYLSDDIVPVEPTSGNAIPFPLTPLVRDHLEKEVAPHRVSAISKTVVDLRPGTVCRQLMPISAVIFPVFNGQPPTNLLPCSPAAAALELLQHCLNLASHREAAVRYLCDLVKRIPSSRVTYSSADLAADLIAQAHAKWHPT